MSDVTAAAFGTCGPSLPSLEHMLTTTRLILRRPTPGDLAKLFEIYGDPATNVFNPFGPYPNIEKASTVLADWMDHWDRLGFGQCAVATRSDPELVIGFGGVAYRNYVDTETLNLGYRLHTAAWGKGYATELGAGVLRHALLDLGKPEVFAIVRPINTPSIHVLEKIGMQRVGSLEDVPGQEPSLLYRAGAIHAVAANPSIERTHSSVPRTPPVTAHAQR